ncbi:MAG TPA: tripartite tricarboxylate transporter permease [Hyphomicrobiaceae bacterium]|nr:tripartite tricarboxylate transporter permease [Hyphomicrobiaceae bacterium]
MEGLTFLLNGMIAASTGQNLLFAVAGCFLGTLIGVLPGVGPAAGTAILIPLTFKLDATAGIIMLCAIYYGAMYGGTITSVLINVPGEAASVVTCLDGYEMAKQGRGGTALGIAAIGSFIGGSIATLALVVVAPYLAQLGLRFGPPEFFGLMLLGLCLVTALAGRSIVAGLLMAIVGLLLSLVGQDPTRGAPRFTFDIVALYDGVDFIPVVMGLFGVGELLSTAEKPYRDVLKTNLTRLFPTAAEWKRSIGAIFRGSGIGLFMGLIPGVGAIVPTFMAYILEKKLSRHPEQFGKGAIEGVAAPETANNAYANASMIPLLTLGIPSSPTIAIIMGAFIMKGLAPGPFLFSEKPDLVWAVIASFFVGNVILLVMNLPFVGLWARILHIPWQYICVGTLLFCILGAYSLRQSVFDIWVMLAFGIIGFTMRKLDLPTAPLILGLILGKELEKNLRTSLEMSGGDFSIFFTRWLSLALLIMSAMIIIGSALSLAPKEVRESTAD